MTTEEYNLALWRVYLQESKWIEDMRKEILLPMGIHFAKGEVAFLYDIYYAIREEERFCINEKIDLTYERQGEEHLLRYQGETSYFTGEEICKIIISMIGIFEDILPLGSVVDLKKDFMKDNLPVDEIGHVRVVITHRFVGEGPKGLYYPYAGTLYPTGIPGSQTLIEFTPALIEKPLQEGFSDAQEREYLYLMKRELILERGMKSVGFAEEDERRAYIEHMRGGAAHVRS